MFVNDSECMLRANRLDEFAPQDVERRHTRQHGVLRLHGLSAEPWILDLTAGQYAGIRERDLPRRSKEPVQIPALCRSWKEAQKSIQLDAEQTKVLAPQREWLTLLAEAQVEAVQDSARVSMQTTSVWQRAQAKKLLDALIARVNRQFGMRVEIPPLLTKMIRERQ